MKPAYRNTLLLLVFAALLAALAAVLCLSPAGARLLQALVDAGGRIGSGGQARQVQAIMLLGGRTARVHAAARLHQATGLPILITGKGTGDSGFRAESEKMQDILRKEYRIEPRAIETESETTQENAAFSWCLWGRHGVRRVLLVTDLQHMLRARVAFSLAGFDVVPAPALQASPPAEPLNLRSWWPSAEGFELAQPPLRQLGGAAALVVERLRDGSPGCAAAEAGPASGNGSPGLPPARE